VNELPDRAVIHREASLAQLDHKAAQRERSLMTALDEPGTMRTGNLPWLVPTHLTRPNAARRAEAPYPIDHRAHAQTEPGRRLAAGQAIDFHRPYRPLPQIHGITRISHTEELEPVAPGFASMAYVLITALRRIGLKHTQFAQATCGTIRLKLLKIGALVTISVRRIKIAMASGCPYAHEFGLAHAFLASAVR
jgi:hypothetical protein